VDRSNVEGESRVEARKDANADARLRCHIRIQLQNPESSNLLEETETAGDKCELLEVSLRLMECLGRQ
jgi:hypothetical protein